MKQCQLNAVNHLQNIINSLNYIVKNSCPFRLERMPLKKTPVYHTCRQWFAILKPQIFFYAPQEKFIVLLYITMTFEHITHR